MESFLPIIQDLISKYPAVSTVIFAIGALRLVMKPVMSALRSYVDYTATPDDNAKLDAVEASKIYTTVCYVLDWIASVKIGPQAK